MAVAALLAPLGVAGSPACASPRDDQRLTIHRLSDRDASPPAAPSLPAEAEAAVTPPTSDGAALTEGIAVDPRPTGAAVPATITYYHPSLEGDPMACGGRYHADDPTIAAATSWPCGTRLRVCHGAACVAVIVQDTGHMGANWVDLSASAFRQLAPLAEMRVTGTVEAIRE